jgi:hypothetical protein
MSSLCQHLADQGGVLLAAATCLLAVGCVGVALQRSPIHRQRAGEMAILAVLAGLILACLPLPRCRLPDCWPAGLAASGSPPPAETIPNAPLVFEPVNGPILAEATGEKVPPMPIDLLPPDSGAAAEGGGVPLVMLPEPREPPTVAEPDPLPTTDVLTPTRDEDQQSATVDRSSAAPPGGTGVTPVARQAAPAFDVRYWLPLAYVAGGLACLVWLALGRVLLLRMVWSARAPEPWLWEVYQRLASGTDRSWAPSEAGHRAKLGTERSLVPGRHRPRLLISDRCTRALSFGIWRPTIVLPGDACRADRAEALRYVLLHELAHARQRDGWGHLLFNLAFTLLYFHPLYWWIRSRAYLAAELIADDWAAGWSAKESYVEALIALTKGGGRRQLACVGSLRIFGSRSQFYRRMQMLLDRETRLARRCSPRWSLIYPAACLLAVLLVAGTVGVRPAEAQPDEGAAPAAGVVAEPTPPGEQTTEPVPAAQPAVEVKTEAVAQPREPSPDGGEVAPSREDTNALRVELLRRERDDLRGLLQHAQAAMDELRKELDALKAERVVWRRGPVTSRTGTLWPGAPSGPVAPTPPPSAGIAVPPGMPVLPTQPTLPGTAPPAPPVPASGPMPPGALLPPATAALVTPVPIEPRFAATMPPTYPGGVSDERRMPEGPQLDLVRLATSSADAAGELEIALLEHESRKQLAERNTIPAQELAIAEIKLKTAQRKVALLRSIAEAALMAAEAELGASRAQMESVIKRGPSETSAIEAAKAQVIRAQSKISILKAILTRAAPATQ